jgi:hypothetical protein
MREQYIDEATFSEHVVKLDSTYRLLAGIALGLIIDLAISVRSVIGYATDKSTEPFFFRDRPEFDPFPVIFLSISVIIIYWVWKPWPKPLETTHGAPLLAGGSNVQSSPAFNTHARVSDDVSDRIQLSVTSRE